MGHEYKWDRLKDYVKTRPSSDMFCTTQIQENFGRFKMKTDSKRLTSYKSWCVHPDVFKKMGQIRVT